MHRRAKERGLDYRTDRQIVLFVSLKHWNTERQGLTSAVEGWELRGGRLSQGLINLWVCVLPGLLFLGLFQLPTNL